MTHRRILVTGANGFIGSRLCAYLQSNGEQVIAQVRKSSNQELLHCIDIEKRFGDVTDSASLEPMMRDIDVVIHNAGIVKAKQEQEFWKVNVDGTANVIDAIKKSGRSVHLILISSLAAIGPSRGVPLDESSPMLPVTAYGESKRDAETVANKAAPFMQVTILRPSGVYGPGDRESFTLFQAVARGFKPILGNPDRKIQLIHVDDLVRAILNAAKLPLLTDEAPCRTYHLADAEPYTMRQLFDQLDEVNADMTGKRAMTIQIPAGLLRGIAQISKTMLTLFGQTPMLTPRKAAELLGSWEVATSRAEAELGFRSAISFRDGARTTFAWYRQKGWIGNGAIR